MSGEIQREGALPEQPSEVVSLISQSAAKADAKALTAEQLSRAAYDAAATGKTARLFELLEQPEVKKYATGILIEAAESGDEVHLRELLAYMRNSRIYINERFTTTEAARLGCWNAVWQLIECGFSADLPYIAYKAALEGEIKMLERLREMGFTWDIKTTGGAAESGNIDMLKLLCDHGCPLEDSACLYAARGGRIETLEWLRDQGCRWGPETCEVAARNGQLETLQWLRENNCEWDWRTCNAAWFGEHWDLISPWLESTGCPCRKYDKCGFRESSGSDDSSY